MRTIINNIRIAAITTYLPTTKLEMSSLSSQFGEHDVTNIIAATGVERVRVADDHQTSSDLCFFAARQLIEKEELQCSEIDGLIFVSQTPDYILPSTSILLQDRLGLSKQTVCIDIHYGCSGYIYGLFQAAMWISNHACGSVLILAGDTTSKMIHPKDKSLKMVFGDCGSATLVTKGSSTMGVSICSDGSGYDKLIVPAGGFRTPCSQETEIETIDLDNNVRTPQNLYMDGMAIFDFAINNIHHNINDLIDQMGWEKDAVKLFALHQANNFMVNYIRKKLKVPPQKVPTNVTNYGNTGPSSIPLLLCDLCSGKTNEFSPLNKVIMSGFGVGLSWGSIAADLSKTRFYKPINQ